MMTILAVTNATLFEDDEARPSSTIRFEASPGAIMNDTSLEDTDSIIDGTGCTLLPAFIDCHIDAAAVNSALQIFASFGIATVVDMVSGILHHLVTAVRIHIGTRNAYYKDGF